MIINRLIIVNNSKMGSKVNHTIQNSSQLKSILSIIINSQ